ncbi:MAG: sigma-70 family RNA polymerase sigma factor [Candidatus Sulfopaludibacter sp.]|nr:sigma-70 family RNA polymerase sigma factor [Candidatus Sulfopaludibacter sp.]
MPETRELELIAACKRGDEAALGELFQRHYPASLRVARAILRSEEDSQDAVQSAYLTAFRRLDSFRGDSAFKTWITRIVTNHCLMLLRQPRFRFRWINFDELAGSGPSGQPVAAGLSPEKSALSGELASALSEAAARLPERLCEVFKLYAFSGLTIREVAKVTGLTLPAAKTRLFRAQTRMRAHLQPVWSSATVREEAA